jgi:hypothetical protein
MGLTPMPDHDDAPLPTIIADNETATASGAFMITLRFGLARLLDIEELRLLGGIVRERFGRIR